MSQRRRFVNRPHSHLAIRRRPGRSRAAWLATTLLLLAGCGANSAGTDAGADAGAASLFDAGAADSGTQADIKKANGDTSAADSHSPDAGAAPDTSAGDFDVAFPTTDGACTPQCAGKACGPDGCGSVCGFCPSGEVCAPDGGKCQAFCKPVCTDKKCGDNGCGGSCGDCPKDYSCGVDFSCHKDDCTGSCALAGGGTKVCGGNGCGGSCGDCATGDLCDDAKGVCEATACKGIPKDGSCAGDVLTLCVGTGASAQKTVTFCDSQVPKKVCGYDTNTSQYGCIDKPACTPACTDKDGKAKECGGDGCGGTCGGGCTAGWACPGGFCEAKQGATCGPLFPPAGQCEGTTWLFCSSDVIQALDCTKVSQTCGWNAAAKSFGCQ